eukprot:PhM_4_TR18820/c3_g1_i1/m.95856
MPECHRCQYIARRGTAVPGQRVCEECGHTSATCQCSLCYLCDAPMLYMPMVMCAGCSWSLGTCEKCGKPLSDDELHGSGARGGPDRRRSRSTSPTPAAAILYKIEADKVYWGLGEDGPRRAPAVVQCCLRRRIIAYLQAKKLLPHNNHHLPINRRAFQCKSKTSFYASNDIHYCVMQRDVAAYVATIPGVARVTNLQSGKSIVAKTKETTQPFVNHISVHARILASTKESSYKTLTMPDDVWVSVFDFLSVREVARLSATCRGLYLCTMHNTTWLSLLQRDASSSVPPSATTTTTTD